MTYVPAQIKVKSGDPWCYTGLYNKAFTMSSEFNGEAFPITGIDYLHAGSHTYTTTLVNNCKIKVVTDIKGDGYMWFNCYFYDPSNNQVALLNFRSRYLNSVAQSNPLLYAGVFIGIDVANSEARFVGYNMSIDSPDIQWWTTFTISKRVRSGPDVLTENIFDYLQGALLVTDPYAQGGNSTVENTSSGTFDATSDSIAVPSTPALSAQSGGLIALYEIDAANMATFANYLFGGFDPTNFHKLFESPMEAILCLNYFPYTPPAAATATEISFGSTGTGANGNLLSAQYDEVDCGTVDLDPYYGSCLDFAPYTRVTLVLPYCGTAELDPDEFMGKTIGVVYKVDCYTGACLALVTADGDVLVQVAGTLANPLPISASNYSSILSSIATVAVAAGTAVATVATGGASTPVAVALTGSLGATAAGSVMSAKPHYNHGGSGGMGSGMFGVQKPYLIIKRPRQCLPENNNNYQGYPSFVTKVLGNCYGFTKVNEIHLEGLSATDGEKKELEAILKGGVWF